MMLLCVCALCVCVCMNTFGCFFFQAKLKSKWVKLEEWNMHDAVQTFFLHVRC